MPNYFTFNGKSSLDYGIYIEHTPDSVHAERRGELFTVPGRNGLLVREEHAWGNYNQTYEVGWKQDISEETASDIVEWLLNTSGYVRLEDSYEPNVFRKARFASQISISQLRKIKKAKLVFDCQPQRYLKSGETPISFSGSAITTINNPTSFEARPLLKFTDTSTTPSLVHKTLTMREDYIIDANGEVYETPDASMLGKYRTSNPVNISGAAKVQISGNGYAFLDSNGRTRSGGFVKTGGFIDGMSVSGRMEIVPSWATSIVVSDAIGNSRRADLYTQAPRPNPGASAVTINGIVINLDFSEHDTIYLDCQLHDAYYEDGSNANTMVSFASSVVQYPTFPVLSPGVNSVIPGNGEILNFELTPRWWIL